MVSELGARARWSKPDLTDAGQHGVLKENTEEKSSYLMMVGLPFSTPGISRGPLLTPAFRSLLFLPRAKSLLPSGVHSFQPYHIFCVPFFSVYLSHTGIHSSGKLSASCLSNPFLQPWRIQCLQIVLTSKNLYSALITEQALYQALDSEAPKTKCLLWWYILFWGDRYISGATC